MRVVAFADLHLGFRAHQRLTKSGLNQREDDVSRTFSTLIDRVIAVAPDAILIGGDVFHSPRPSTDAIVHAFAEFSRLVDELPDTPICISAGNHDLSKAQDKCVLQLFANLGIHIADRQAKRFLFEDLGLSVLAVPDAPGLQRPALVPDSRASKSVLVLHGEVQGMLPAWAKHGDRASEIMSDEIGAAAWNFVALGHWHVYRQLAPNMYYTGSIDYTSSNTWGEIKDEDAAGLRGKGFIERDLETGEQTFHELPASRQLIDLPPIDADGMGAADLDAAIFDVINSRVIDDAIVRLIVENVPLTVRRSLDQKALREYRRRALAFTLDLRRPEFVRATSIEAAGADRRKLRSLEDEVQARFADVVRCPLPSDVDRAAFQARAAWYLEHVRDPYLEAPAVEKIELPALEKAS